MARWALVVVLLFFSHCSRSNAARLKQSVKPTRLDNSEATMLQSSAPEPAALWEEYLGFQDLNEMMQGVKENPFKRKIALLGISGMESMLKELEEANKDNEYFEAFEALVKKVISRLQAAEDKKAAKDAASKGATDLDKTRQREIQKAKWQKILDGRENCPTGVTVKFVKAGTLDEALTLGVNTTSAHAYEKEDTILAFDMDGTLVDMRDFKPKEMMQNLLDYEASDKVVITAADNRLGCGAVTSSLVASLKDGESAIPTRNDQCDRVVQGAKGDNGEKELEEKCWCPENFFVNGLADECRDKQSLTRERAVNFKAVDVSGAKCYCEPDLFNVFGIDAAAACPEMTDATGNFMIAKNGVIMDRYAKAEGLTAYYKDKALSKGRTFKQVVFFDDWVENPVNFAQTLCFVEAPPGLSHVVAVWYATDRMEEREKVKMARLKAGKMAADSSEGNYFHPTAWNDARLAGMRAMFGID